MAKWQGYTGELPVIYRPLMFGPTLKKEHCCVCGRYRPLNQHHYVWRSWGKLKPCHADKWMPKPTVTLCGIGNTSGCHRLAHERRLHFRVSEDGCLEFLRTEETDYATALEMDGWRRCR